MCSWQWVLIFQSPKKGVTLRGLVDRYKHLSKILVPAHQTAKHQILRDCNLNKNNKGISAETTDKVLLSQKYIQFVLKHFHTTICT